MVCLGLEPRAAGWKAQTNPLSYVQHLVYCTILLNSRPSRWKASTSGRRSSVRPSRASWASSTSCPCRSTRTPDGSSRPWQSKLKLKLQGEGGSWTWLLENMDFCDDITKCKQYLVSSPSKPCIHSFICCSVQFSYYKVLWSLKYLLLILINIKV